MKGLKKNKKACPESGQRVFVAMSGGVDSSVAAALLKKQGYDVVGVFMKFWADSQSALGRPENRCCSLEARRDAMRVCSKLNIPFLTWDFQREFKRAVVDDFISGYKKGNTPNPCVVCNKEIKFGLFLKKALELGADYIATGHYVRLAKRKNFIPLNALVASSSDSACLSSPTDSDRCRRPCSVGCGVSENKIFSLYQAKDKNKDQSYFLWRLTQKQLKHCLFPIGDYTKDEVRALAKKYKLPVAFKKESQEVCFVKDADLYGFLRTRIHTDKGEIIELKTGKKIGEHNGVQFYTIGQRVPIGGTGPYYVVVKNLKKNQLIVVGKGNKNSLFKEIALKNVNWISDKPLKSAKVLVRTRYRQPLVLAKIVLHASRFKLYFDQPVKFIAPGQSAVFYNRDGELLGGGVIY